MGVPVRDVSRLKVRRPESNFYRTSTPRLPGALEHMFALMDASPGRRPGSQRCTDLLRNTDVRGHAWVYTRREPKEAANAMTPHFRSRGVGERAPFWSPSPTKEQP